MSKKNLILIGRIAVIISLVMFSWSIKLAFDAKEVGNFSIEISPDFQEFDVQLSIKRHSVVKIKLDVSSSSIQEDKEGIEDFEIRYSFPIKYEILDSQGKVVFYEESKIDWDSGMKSFSDKNVSLDGGKAEVTTSFSKFKVNAPLAKVRLKIDPDTKYKAQASNAKLVVFDMVSVHLVRGILAFILLLAGYYFVKAGKAIGAEASKKKRIVAFLLCFLVGFFGIHRFYVGRYISGIFMIFTLGGVGLWMWADTITILAGWFIDKDKKRVVIWL